ncbi:hypothetical protein [Yersinia alsatica]|nr:hypothetical protein [Yersinia alsatica]
MSAANTAAAPQTQDTPKSLGLQQGSQRAHPDELTQVSDSGE